MTQTYYTYRIRITNYERVEVEKSNASNSFQGKLEGKFSLTVNQEKLGEIAESLMSNSITDQRLIRTLGELLFDSIFDPALCHDFLTTYEQVVRQSKNLLRIELDIDEKRMPEIAALPWEFLCLPEKLNKGTIWFATHPNLIFSRRRQLWQPARAIQLGTGEKLKIGLAFASPENLPAVMYQPVLKQLEKLGKEQPDRIELLPVIEQANPRKINRFLEENQPHIFHFIGHGQFLDNQHGQIALANNLNKPLWIDAEDFAEYLNVHYPSVIVLQACEGAMPSSSQAFASVAARIVNQNIPVVVAMQYEVSNATACTFALEIYQRLGDGEPVDIAVQKGRREVVLSTNYKQRDFATPVLFMNVQDGYLFERDNFPNQPSKVVPEPNNKETQLDDQQYSDFDLFLKELLNDRSQVNTDDRHKIFRFKFETVKVNSVGDIKTIQGEARYFTEILPGGVELDMVYIPAGEFMMGAKQGEEGARNDEYPQHKVTIAKPFYMSKYPINQAQYKAIMGNNPSNFQGEQRPVEQVSWDMAQEFCKKLSKQTGKEYSLPSEAKWEYVARAGTTTPFHFGETLTDKLANYDANYTYVNGPKGQYREETTEVGIFPPNFFGLYDIHGNVCEWCEDSWHSNYIGAPHDGSSWVSNDENHSRRVLRGSSWYNNPGLCRVAYRGYYNRTNFSNSIGFRVSCEVV